MVDMYVSALDALRYLEPEWTDEKRFLKMASLPRAAIIKAFWPPTAQHRKLKDSCFDAVKFDNVQLLLECDGADAVANDFRQQAKEVALFPGSHPFLLVEDAALTASQKRYQRDISMRLLQPEKYYSMKRNRDKASKERIKKQKLVTIAEEVEAAEPHYLFHWSWNKKQEKTDSN